MAKSTLTHQGIVNFVTELLVFFSQNVEVKSLSFAGDSMEIIFREVHDSKLMYIEEEIRDMLEEYGSKYSLRYSFNYSTSYNMPSKLTLSFKDKPSITMEDEICT